MLRVLEGARGIDDANSASDIPQANYAAANTMNSTSVDMGNPAADGGFEELLVNVRTGVVLGTATLVTVVQESNEATANFTNTTAFLNFAAADDNKSKWASVLWTHPDRKRYARIQGVTAGNTVEYGAATLRVQNRQKQSRSSTFVFA